MLVLGRKCGESVCLETSDGPIVITVHRGKGVVRLAIEAPKQVKILRMELDAKPEAVQQ